MWCPRMPLLLQLLCWSGYHHHSIVRGDTCLKNKHLLTFTATLKNKFPILITHSFKVM